MKADDKTLTEGKLLNWYFAFLRFALKTKRLTIHTISAKVPFSWHKRPK